MFFKTSPSNLWKRRKKHTRSYGDLAFLGDKKCFKAGRIVMSLGAIEGQYYNKDIILVRIIIVLHIGGCIAHGCNGCEAINKPLL